jgi:hypothetical protein
MNLNDIWMILDNATRSSATIAKSIISIALFGGLLFAQKGLRDVSKPNARIFRGMLESVRSELETSQAQKDIIMRGPGR